MDVVNPTSQSLVGPDNARCGGLVGNKKRPMHNFSVSSASKSKRSTSFRHNFIKVEAKEGVVMFVKRKERERLTGPRVMNVGEMRGA